MSLKPIIAMFVTCMAPLFLVYFVVDGIYMLQLEKTTYVNEKTDFDSHADFKTFTILCVASVVAWALLSIYFAMFGGRKRAEEHARRKAISGDVGQRDKGQMEWFDIDLLEDDNEVDEEDEKRFHFFEVDDDIGDIRLESDGSNEGIEDDSQETMAGFDGVY